MAGAAKIFGLVSATQREEEEEEEKRFRERCTEKNMQKGWAEAEEHFRFTTRTSLLSPESTTNKSHR
ncbi:hypothetical protein CHARACLAT_002378 [Characodon lateralis]|uniref:Uncharacterized protein n=1 Tax=Characodon lateralis TaxID=208331 RepID=A0ABU7DD00_9TELE|nr:hypothetical protein [Characodon lateralis]